MEIHNSGADASANVWHCNGKTPTGLNFSTICRAHNKKDLVTCDEPPETLVTCDEPPETLVTRDEPPETLVTSDQPPETLVTSEEPPGTLVTHEEPPETLVTCDEPPGTLVTCDEPPRTLVTCDEPPGTLVTHEEPPEELVTHEKPPDELTTHEEPPEKWVTRVEPPETLVNQYEPPGEQRQKVKIYVIFVCINYVRTFRTPDDVKNRNKYSAITFTLQCKLKGSEVFFGIYKSGTVNNLKIVVKKNYNHIQVFLTDKDACSNTGILIERVRISFENEHIRQASREVKGNNSEERKFLILLQRECNGRSRCQLLESSRNPLIVNCNCSNVEIEAIEIKYLCTPITPNNVTVFDISKDNYFRSTCQRLQTSTWFSIRHLNKSLTETVELKATRDKFT
ncbi:hypothetical protein Btru_043137 [Bulinus truncatus]|nr:hypothetical protein Btru_043137 [Bulinus truncatus]